MRGKIKLYHYQGKDYSITKIAEMTGMERATLVYRLNNGYTLDEAINAPLTHRKREQFSRCDTWPDCFNCPHHDCIVSTEPKTGGSSVRVSQSMVIPYKPKTVSRRMKKASWYYMTQEDVSKIKKERCKKCQYFHAGTCDYFLITGERRGCRPDKCTHYLDEKISRNGMGTLNEAANDF